MFPISKATELDRTFPPAWFGIRISYAAQEEGDQAMTSFGTTTQLSPESLYLICFWHSKVTAY